MLLCLLYDGDDLVLRRRIAENRGFEAVTIEHDYAIHEKNGKTEYVFQAPTAEQCVHALFPHRGCRPCWYVKRRAERRTDI